MSVLLATAIYTDPATKVERVVHVADCSAEKRPFMTCKFCKQKVHAKQGSVKIHHYAHSKDAHCSEHVEKGKTCMSVWHRDFQTACKPEMVEACIRNAQNKVMRADVFDSQNSVVWEMQNSDLSSEKVFLRERFYSEMGLDLRWIANLTGQEHLIHAKCSLIETGAPCYILKSNKRFMEHTTRLMLCDTDFGLFHVHRLLNGYYLGVLVDPTVLFAHIQRTPCEPNGQYFLLGKKQIQYPWFTLRKPIKLLPSGLIYNVQAQEFTAPKNISVELETLLQRELHFQLDHKRNVYVNRGMPKNMIDSGSCEKTENEIRVAQEVKSFIRHHKSAFGKTRLSNMIKIHDDSDFHAKLEALYNKTTECYSFQKKDDEDDFIIAGSCASYIFHKALSELDEIVTCSWMFNEIDIWKHEKDGDSRSSWLCGDTIVNVTNTKKALSVKKTLQMFDIPCYQVARSNENWFISDQAFYALLTKVNIVSVAAPPKAILLQCLRNDGKPPLLFNLFNAERELKIFQSYQHDLKCSFRDREIVKAAGACWNSKTKKWTPTSMTKVIDWIALKQSKENAELLHQLQIVTFKDPVLFWANICKSHISLTDARLQSLISVYDCKKLPTLVEEYEIYKTVAMIEDELKPRFNRIHLHPVAQWCLSVEKAQTQGFKFEFKV